MVKEGACSLVGHRKSCRKGYLEHLLFWCSEKKQSPRYGGEMVQEFSDSVFFTPFPPHVWDSVFFQCTKTASALDTPSCNFSEPGFWILTNGG